MAPVSVIIPAHNESAVLERCLSSLLRDAAPDELQVIVVCNGCEDDTATIASRYTDVQVLELAEASKVTALNAGDAVARHYPRFYVDADAELTVGAVRQVAGVLGAAGIQCAAPAPHFELSGRPYLVRAFYDVWRRLPYLTDQPVGNGVYALSESGRGRFDRFPDVTGDDLFVRNLFSVEQREVVRDASFTIHTPRSVAGLFRLRVRAYRGSRELSRQRPELDRQVGGRLPRLVGLLRSPRLVPAVVVYGGFAGTAKVVAAWRVWLGRSEWERDDSARTRSLG